MKNKTIFRGAGVAVVTPFINDKVDYNSLGNIIDYQIKCGTDAIVICGTTGESSTLTDEEHRMCIEFAVKHTAGRVPVIAGTGSNDTQYSIELSKHACEAGADALLLVTPYYNKATQKGLIKSFSAIADASTKPIILYNVPQRTGCSINVSTYKELAKHENIAAVKEANSDISKITELFAECGDELDIYSGNDDQIIPFLALGGCGVISVLSNVMPSETHEICKLWFDGKIKESASLQLKLIKLINALFCEVNPIPVKTAMEALGWCKGEIRMPLCEMDDKNKQLLLSAMRELDLIK